VVDGADENAATAVGQKAVNAARAHESLGHEARLASGEEGAAPHFLQRIDRLST
jgi:hypothetical protein